MSYRDQLLANQMRHEQQGHALFERAQASLDSIRAKLERRDRNTQEAIEAARQSLEDSKSAAEKRAEREWSGDGHKFGNLVDDEPETSTPVRRAPRDDASTRNFWTARAEQDPLPHRENSWGGTGRRVGER